MFGRRDLYAHARIERIRGRRNTLQNARSERSLWDKASPFQPFKNCERWSHGHDTARLNSKTARGTSVSDFRKLSDTVFASPQIEISDLQRAKELGVGMIVNNRPDGEDPAAPQGSEIADAARAAGLEYVAIPVGHSGFSEPQIDELMGAMEQADGSILAYCRSGTRSTFLWALAQAKSGQNPDEITASAMAAGYDVSPVRPMLDMLFAR